MRLPPRLFAAACAALVLATTACSNDEGEQSGGEPSSDDSTQLAEILENPESVYQGMCGKNLPSMDEWDYHYYVPGGWAEFNCRDSDQGDTAALLFVFIEPGSKQQWLDRYGGCAGYGVWVDDVWGAAQVGNSDLIRHLYAIGATKLC